MIIKHSFAGRSFYSHERDYREEEEQEFWYEPEHDEVLDALAYILVSNVSGVKDLTDKEYSLSIKITKNLIENEDLFDSLCEEYYDEIKEYFEEDAKEMFRWDYMRLIIA